MKQFFSLFILLASFGLATAQTPDTRHLDRLLSRINTKSHAVSKGNLREEVSCTRETDFSFDDLPAQWDSNYQTIRRVDITAGYTTFREEIYSYDATEGFIVDVITVIYGVDGSDFDLQTGRFDSIAQFTLDPFSGDLAPYTRFYPTYLPNDKLGVLNIHVNLGIFGLPLGFVHFGQQLYYYDGNNYLIATATKEADLGAFPINLINADSSSYVNYPDGSANIVTNYSWDKVAGTYDEISRETYTYDPVSGNISSEIFESHDGMGWIYTSYNTYTYNSNGDVASIVTHMGVPGSWTPTNDQTYNYDAQFRLVLILEQIIQPNGTKTPINRRQYKYDNPQGWISEQIDQSYTGGQWQNSYRVLFELCDNIGNPPFAPNTLTATSQGINNILLTWNDNSVNEDGFIVERSTDGLNFIEVHTTAADVTSWNNGGLNPGTLFYFRVIGFNQAGFSVYSNVASAETMPSSIYDPSLDGSVGAWCQADGSICVRLEHEINAREITILSSNGQVITRVAVYTDTQIIPAGHLIPGIYFVQVILEDGRVVTRKIVRP